MLYVLEMEEIISVWEMYEIHETVPRKIASIGTWTHTTGLEISQPQKWIRRKNLEVASTQLNKK